MALIRSCVLFLNSAPQYKLRSDDNPEDDVQKTHEIFHKSVHRKKERSRFGNLFGPTRVQ
jgi:hypothetical protein